MALETSTTISTSTITTTTTTTVTTTTSTTTSPTTSTSTTTSSTTGTTATFIEISLLSRSVWLSVVRKGDNHFYYVNDEDQKVDSESLFTDHTATNADGKCAAILPDSENPSNFHLYTVDCEAKAKALCRANATAPQAGENLPQMPCVQMTSRRKRETENEQCNNAETNANACESIVNGIMK